MRHADTLIFNGLNASTGQYSLKLSLAEFSRTIQQKHRPPPAPPSQQTRAVAQHIQATNLAQAGWGILLARNEPRREAILEALSPLLSLRQTQAGDHYRLLTPKQSYVPGESKHHYLTRLGWPAAGPVDPQFGLPYYLLLIGSPAQIPFHFQYQLAVQHAVGRLYFENLADYHTYARTVVEAERGDLSRQAELALFGVQNPADQATRLSTSQLIQPLHHSLGQNLPANWQITLQPGQETRRADLETLLNGTERRPALLFTASHGMQFAPSDARQLAHQGALVCQDWPGPNEWRQAIPPEFYLAGEHLSHTANVGGLISFHFACFGGGTPHVDNFAALRFAQPQALTQQAFLASLPQRLLSHPQGSALAVISHVDRAWSFAFDGQRTPHAPPVYRSTLSRLLEGQPVGHALSYLNERYAELASDLTSLLDTSQPDTTSAADPLTVALLWAAQSDARNLILLGDPAVRVALSPTKTQPPARPLRLPKPDPTLSDADWANTPPAVQAKLNHYSRALSQLAWAEKPTKPTPNHAPKLMALLQAARTAPTPTEASQLYLEALKESTTLNDAPLQAVLWLWFGQSCEAEGDVQRAVSAYEVGFEVLAQTQPGQVDLQSALDSLSHVAKGFMPERPAQLTQPLNPATTADLLTAKSDPLLAERLLLAIGNAYFRQPQDDPARNAYHQAMALPLLQESRHLQAQLLTNLGLLAQRNPHTPPAQARRYFQQALALFPPGHPAQRVAQAALAENSLRLGLPAQAQAEYHTALKLHHQASADQADPPAEARVRLGLAGLFLADGAIPQAETHLQTARHLLKNLPEETETRTRWLILTHLAQCCQADGRLNEAADLLRRSLALAETHRAALRTDQGLVSFDDSVAALSNRLLSLLLHLAEAETGPAQHSLLTEALTLAEASRARAFGALWRYRRRQQAEDKTEAEPNIRPSRLRPFDVRAMVSQRASHTPLHPTANEADFNHPINIQQMAQHALSTPLPPFDPFIKNDENDENDENEAELLPQPPPLARLVFHVLENETLIFAVAPNGAVRHHRQPLGEAALSQAVAELRQALAVDQGAVGVRAAAQPLTRTAYLPQNDGADLQLQALYKQLIAPVVDHLPKNGGPVVLEPHGSLWLLPFAALQNANGTYFIDEFPLLYAPSNQLLNEIRQAPDYGTPQDLSALVVGNPTMPQASTQSELGWQFEALPGAEAEARAVQGHFPPERSELLLGGAATLGAVTAAAEQHGILHFATHGLAFAEKPLDSFLLLADNGEAAEASLWRARAAQTLNLRADLVTLSACQTGLGQISGDGVLGLSRAFLVAGARAVLVSQWRISDQATALLMDAFYEAYVAVDDKALALQVAMAKVRQNHRFRQPRYWAGFAIIGAEA